MEISFFSVYDQCGNLLGSHMTRQNALIFIDALFTKYYNDYEMEIRVKREINWPESNDRTEPVES